MADFASGWGNYLLKDMIEAVPPEAISWWPETTAWLLVAVVVGLSIFLRLYRLYKAYKHNAYRRKALGYLNTWARQNLNNSAAQWPALLKKTAIAAFGRDGVAELTGTAWEQFLDEHCDKTQFLREAQGLLHRLSYQAQGLSVDELKVVYQQVYCWVKHHRVDEDRGNYNRGNYNRGRYD